MRLNYQLSQPVRVGSRWISCATCIMTSFNYPIPCGMDPGGSYVHGDTDFVSIIPACESWVLISNSMLNIFSRFNHPNQRR